MFLINAKLVEKLRVLFVFLGDVLRQPPFQEVKQFVINLHVVGLVEREEVLHLLHELRVLPHVRFFVRVVVRVEIFFFILEMEYTIVYKESEKSACGEVRTAC